MFDIMIRLQPTSQLGRKMWWVCRPWVEVHRDGEGLEAHEIRDGLGLAGEDDHRVAGFPCI